MLITIKREYKNSEVKDSEENYSIMLNRARGGLKKKLARE
jgi:hypothetical protein